MRLVGCGLQGAVEDVVVDPERHLAELVEHVLNLVREVIHEGTDNRVEDSVDRLILQVSVSHDIEMTLKSWSDD